MRRALVTVVCASLALGATTAHAGPAADTTSPRTVVEVPDDDELAVDLAEAAWIRGGWSEVRQVLEPVVADETRLTDPRLRERALCLLADATIKDAALDETERRDQAADYLGKVLDADPNWRLPSGYYSPELSALFAEVADERARQASARCEAARMGCEADLADVTADLVDERRRHAELQQRFDAQEVEVRDLVARSRAFALIPFGVGQFYNGDNALGGVFLGAETALGITGLSLILYRLVADGCRRRQGFQRGSLTCAAGRDLDGILRRRRIEEAVGWVFWGTLALDVVLAQYRFEAFKTEGVRRVPRSQLEGDGDGSDSKRRRRKREARATVRPTASGGPQGVSLGVSVRF